MQLPRFFTRLIPEFFTKHGCVRRGGRRVWRLGCVAACAWLMSGVFCAATARERPPLANDLSEKALFENLGILYENENAPENPLEARRGAGLRVQYKGNVWLFVPLSFLSRPDLPYFYFLDGERVDVTKLPIAFFGDRNLVAFFMGSVADWRAAHPGKIEPLKIAETLDEGNAIPTFLRVQDKDLTPHLFACEVRVDKEAMGRLAIHRGVEPFYRGAALFSQETGLLFGMLQGHVVEDDRVLCDVLDFTRLPEPMPVPWDEILRQRSKYLNLTVRTASLVALCSPKGDAADVKDAAVYSLARSFAKKVKDAAQRKTASLRDTTAEREKFSERLALTLLSDINPKGYTLPFYALAAQEHAKLRKDYIERVRKNNVNEEVILRLAD